MLFLLSLTTLLLLVSITQAKHATEILPYSQYMTRHVEKIGSVALRSFQFLIDSNAFHQNHIHFMIFEGNARDREMTVNTLRQNGWNVTIKSVVVLSAQRDRYLKTHNGYDVCRIYQIEESDDNPQNYLSVMDIDSVQPTIGYAIYSDYSRKKCSVLGSAACHCMLGTWEIEVIKVDMRIWS